MKKKTKLIALISSFCLVLALGIMGVLAVQQQLLNKRALLLLTKRQSVLCEITEYAKTIF